MILIVCAIIACAFARRFAGGLLGQWLGNIGGTQVARLVQAVIVGAVVATVAPVWWWGLAAVPLTFLGATAGFPTGMVPRSVRDLAGLAAHGLMALGPLALAAWWVDAAWWWLVAAGLLRAPAYWLATFWQPRIRALGLNPDGIPDPPALAEFYAGSMMGAAVVLAFGA